MDRVSRGLGALLKSEFFTHCKCWEVGGVGGMNERNALWSVTQLITQVK